MQIEIDDRSGFCFGVVRAISEAEKALEGAGTVYSLGDIVHNRIEVQRLEQLGLRTITHDQMRTITHAEMPAEPHAYRPHERMPAEQHEQTSAEQMPVQPRSRLFIRAHGEPPATYARARALGLELIDATCPVVARLQQRVVKAHEQMRAVHGQVVILGKRGHAEVVGLTGQVTDPTIVIEGEQDLAQIDFGRPVWFLSQTTQSIALFEKLGEQMRRRAAEAHAAAESVRIDDTICRQVANRETHLQEFAARFDVVLFVCGRKSSNGNVLFEVCRAANARSHKIEEPAEIDPDWFVQARSVGICGATSTPAWLMREVAEAVTDIAL